jgi:hypothetical protein
MSNEEILSTFYGCREVRQNDKTAGKRRSFRAVTVALNWPTTSSMQNRQEVVVEAGEKITPRKAKQLAEERPERNPGTGRAT